MEGINKVLDNCVHSQFTIYSAISEFLGMSPLSGQLTGEPVNLANCLVNHQSSQCPKYPTLSTDPIRPADLRGLEY